MRGGRSAAGWRESGGSVDLCQTPISPGRRLLFRWGGQEESPFAESRAQRREQPPQRLLVSFLPDCMVARFGSMGMQEERFILTGASSDRRRTSASRAGSILRGPLVRNMREEWICRRSPTDRRPRRPCPSLACIQASAEQCRGELRPLTSGGYGDGQPPPAVRRLVELPGA